MPSHAPVSLSLLGLLKSWHNYQDLINGRDKLPYLERLWSDLVQEEIRRNTRGGVPSRTREEEDFAIVCKGNMPKARRTKVMQNPTSRTMARRKTSVKLNDFIAMSMELCYQVST